MTEPESRYHDGTYVGHNPDWHESDAAWKASHVYQMLVDHRIVPTSLCDVGCGTGAVLEHLRRLLPTPTRLVGYEPSSQALTLASPERRALVSLIQGDPAADGQVFDVMLMLDVFEHVDDYLGLLRRTVGKARWAVFHIPLDVSVQAVLRATPFVTTRATLGHLHSFTRETAVATLADAGFTVVADRFTAGSLELTPRSWSARAARLPRWMLWRMSPKWAARVLGGFSLLVLATGTGAGAATS